MAIPHSHMPFFHRTSKKFHEKKCGNQNETIQDVLVGVAKLIFLDNGI